MSANPLKATVTGTSESPTKLAVSVRRFSFIIDEPANFGGADAGPNPVEIESDSSATNLNEVLQLSTLRRPVSDNLSHATPIAVRLAASSVRTALVAGI